MDQGGRLILVNPVIRAKPTHHLLVTDAPKWAFERVDKSCRAFSWDGSEEIHGGKCLVAWQNICKPKCFGGLGVLDLQKQIVALRLRWEWLRCTDSTKPFQGLPMVSDPLLVDIFNSLAHWKVGDGWSGVYTASSSYCMLWEGAARFSCANAIWKSWAPLNCKIFIWLALQYRIWTSDRHTRRGLQDQVDACYLCEQRRYY